MTYVGYIFSGAGKRRLRAALTLIHFLLQLCDPDNTEECKGKFSSQITNLCEELKPTSPGPPEALDEALPSHPSRS